MSQEQQQQVEGLPAEALGPDGAAAIEKAQEGLTQPNPNVPAPTGPQKPEWVPEKFWKDGKVDTEGLAKSYSALETKLGSGQPQEQGEQQQQQADPARADGKIEKKDGEEEQAQPSPLTDAMERARDEWATTHEVSEDARKALEDAGIPSAILDLYLEGLRAQTEKVVGEIHSIAGGEDAYNAMVGWAARALPEAEIDAFNDALDNPALREAAILGLQAKFAKANPSEGKLVIPNDGGAAPGDVFSNKDELIAAQKDPRYQTDATYRQSVMEKLQRSQRSGFKLVERPMFERQILSN